VASEIRLPTDSNQPNLMRPSLAERLGAALVTDWIAALSISCSVPQEC